MKTHFQMLCALYALALMIAVFQADFANAKDIKPVEDLIQNGIIINVGLTERDLVNELGHPANIKISYIKNKYHNFDDRTILYKYEGLAIVFYQHNHPLKGWKGIRRIELNNARYVLRYGIRIGMDIEKVLKIIGREYSCRYIEKDKSYFVYESGDSVHEQIVFIFNKYDKLIELVWSNWP